MNSTRRRHSKEDLARIGDSIYESAVQPQLEPEDDGKFVAIDIETGAFEIDADERRAGDKLLERVPGAQIWIVRIGSRFVHRFGASDEATRHD